MLPSKFPLLTSTSTDQIRLTPRSYAPFAYDAWKSPETLAIISKIAGVELVPQMDFEIAHINISMQTEQQKLDSLAALAEKNSRDADEGVSGCPWEDDKPIVDWHTDSYPFVCVTMLSDCTNMIGGETALRLGNGEVMKVRGPQMVSFLAHVAEGLHSLSSTIPEPKNGVICLTDLSQGCAVVLQGRYIEHQALRALGATERITMVTSFRPKSSAIKDDTVLTTVRAISHLPELYYQYSEYRLEMLEERVRKKLKMMREQKRAHRGFDTCAMKDFIKEQEEFLAVMNREIVEDSLVTKGFTDNSHLLSTQLKHRNAKKARTATATASLNRMIG